MNSAAEKPQTPPGQAAPENHGAEVKGGGQRFEVRRRDPKGEWQRVLYGVTLSAALDEIERHPECRDWWLGSLRGVVANESR